jgi:ATP-dependent exoDNAse (exonuclease V) alpha subunit
MFVMNNLKDIVAKLQNNRNVFLTGGAGVGKTTLTRQIIQQYEADGKKVARLASTGMAATLLGGQTLHSFLDLGIANTINDLELRKKLEIKKKIKKLIGSMDLIVIDEISMVSAELFDMVRLRLLQAEFSGALLVVGDFLQLPPVVRGYGSVNFAFESESWQRCDFETVTLTTVYRTSDNDFIGLLDAVRFAQIKEYEAQFLNSLVKVLPHDLSSVTFLFGKNESARGHNAKLLEALEGDLYAFKTEVVLHVKSTTQKDVKRFLEDARTSEILELKIGVPVLFTRNAWNYFNGERGRVINIKEHIVYVEKEDGHIVKLERTSISKSRWEEKLVEGKKEMVEVPIMTLYQYPITLAFGITIHKSQGMSLNDLVIESNEIFAPSQFYVAISRAISPHRLTLIAPKRSWQQLNFVNHKAVAFVKKAN